MRSASRVIAVGLGLGMLAGCSTTQQGAARLRLNNARTRASERPLQLSGRSASVTVVSAALIVERGGLRSAIVVTLRNRGTTATSDLPLLVGVTTPQGQRIYLNAAAGVDYFRSHIPAIPAHGLLRWVVTLGRHLPPGAAAFAEVGASAGTVATTVTSLPPLRIASPQSVGANALVTVENTSAVPQYQLPVYAVARRGERYVGAGQATIADLGSGARVQLRVPLVGDPTRATLSVETPPTIFK